MCCLLGVGVWVEGGYRTLKSEGLLYAKAAKNYTDAFINAPDPNLVYIFPTRLSVY